MANYDVTLQVTPTPSAEVQIATDPGSGISASNAEAWAVGKRGGVDVESTDVTYHNNSKYYAQQCAGAEQAAQDAEAAKQAAQAAVAHYPYVDTTTGNWMCWDTTNSQWVNTGVHAQGPTGTVPDLTVGTVTTLSPGSNATVTRRSGSPDTAPIFDFGIPKGDTGTAENVYGSTIPMSDSDSTKVKTAIDGKASKVASATSGNFAALDSSGNLTDSGHKHSDYLTSHQDITGKADKVSSATSGNFAGLDSNGNLTDSGHKHSDYLTSHQDISGKADKVSGATGGNFAGLDVNGNLADSGSKASDFKTTQTAVTDPTASGNAISFIDSISQNTNGVITPTKKTVQSASSSQAGVMSAADKVALDGVQDALAIVVSGDTAPANIASGAYIFLKGHITLASGGYHATAAISSGDTISSSNVTADSDGIANALNSKCVLFDGNTTFTQVKQVNVSVNSTDSYQIPATRWYILRLQFNDANYSGDECQILIGQNVLVKLISTGIKWHQQQIQVPIKQGTTLTFKSSTHCICGFEVVQIN